MLEIVLLEELYLLSQVVRLAIGLFNKSDEWISLELYWCLSGNQFSNVFETF